MKLALRTLLAATLFSSLSACALLGGKTESLTVYAPVYSDAASSAVRQAKTRTWQLLIAEPEAREPLAGSRIVVMPKAGTIQFYRGARWSDSLPAMSRALLRDAFVDSRGLPGVGMSSSRLNPDFVLETSWRDFQAEYRGGSVPVVRLRLSARLLEAGSGRLVATNEFDIEQACDAADLARVTQAFQLGLNRELGEVVEWTLQQGDAASQALPPGA